MAIPTADQSLLEWCRRFLDVVRPEPGAFGLDPALVAELDAATDAYGETWSLAQMPATRTSVVVMLKNERKAVVDRLARTCSGVCDAWQGMTDDVRSKLGLHVRKRKAYRVPVPTLVPRVEVVGVRANELTILARNPLSGERKRPPGVHAIGLYSFVGPNGPATPGEMRFEGLTTNLKATLTFPLTTAPFATVWVAACYLNPRGEHGPISSPISTNLGTWAVRSVEAGQAMAA
jgi:hypothetical protein